jgi:hypothetical protein
MSTATASKVLFERGTIRVSTTRFETGFETYPIKKISAIRIDAEKRRTAVGIPLAAVGAAGLVAGALTNIPLFIVAGAAFTVGGAMLSFAKTNRSIVLTVQGREQKAITSKDAALIQAIVVAVQDAMAQRGQSGK